MKKVLLCCLLVPALITFFFPPGSAEEVAPTLAAKPEYVYWVNFSYFTSNSRWWTGLALLNQTQVENEFIIRVYDQEGNEEAWGEFTVDALEQAVFTLDNLEFIDHGTLPERGHFAIGATEDFSVVKFTGDRDSGAFSEIEKQAEIVPPVQ